MLDSNAGPSSILLVDDNPGVLYSTSRILNGRSYQVATAQNADEAINLVKNRKFDLVVCDINMPGRSGLEFLNDLRRYDPTIASVVLTANGTVAMAIQAMRSGALGFVTKPFKENELVEAIEEAIKQAQQVREAFQVEFYTPMLESLCDALLNTMEAGEYANQGSNRRIAQHARQIAQLMQIPQELAYQIYLAGLFHDIGKIGVPDEIIRKHALLTSEEQHILDQHPELGSRIVEQARGMEEAARIIRHYREHYDGTGRPDQLSAEEIPLGSRIVAVVSYYEDRVSVRPHSPGISHEEALAELAANKHTLFDPKIVELALQVLTPRATTAEV